MVIIYASGLQHVKSIVYPAKCQNFNVFVAVTTGPAGAIMSPYLNFDPAYLGTVSIKYIIYRMAVLLGYYYEIL